MTPFLAPEDTKLCPDCRVHPGEHHVDGCDVARCLWTGWQAIACNSDLADEDDHHDCGTDTWTGEWPGEADARRLGFFGIEHGEEGTRFVPCDANHPGATPDLNRLYMVARWDRQTKRWEATPAQGADAG